MTHRIASILPLLLILTGCTITSVTHREDAQFASSINEKGQSKVARVTTRRGETLRARALRLDGDSLTFLQVYDRSASPDASPLVIQMGADEIADVKFVDHGNGAAEGLGFGTVGGFVFGFAIGAASAHEPCEGFLDLTCGSKSSVGAAVGLVFAIPSALFGLIGGAVRGKHYRFQFQPRAPGRSR